MNDPAPAPATPAAPAPISAIESIYGPSKTTAAPVPEPTPEPAAAPAPDEPAAAPAATVGPNAAPAADDSQTEDIELSKIAAVLGVEESDLDVDESGRVVFVEQVNGETVRAPAGDTLKNHRMYQAADQRLAEAKQKSQALMDETTKKSAAWDAMLSIGNKLVQTAEAMALQEFRGINWNDLEKNDPAMYATQRTKLYERKAELDAIKRQVLVSQQEAEQKRAAEAKAAKEQRVPQELEVLYGLVPDWRDKNKFMADRQLIAEYLHSNLSKEAADFVMNDGALLGMVEIARRAGGNQAKLEAIKKKVAKIPKVLKPGPKPAAAKPNGAAKTDPVSILYGS